ncbi:MAG TPA: hypothetical protein VIL47_00605 [Candidatus Bipolaricaulota bacterium]
MMNDHVNPVDFAELTWLRFSVPFFVLVTLALMGWDSSWGLGYALGAAGGLLGSYFSWLHLQKLAESLSSKSQGQLQRSAFGGGLAGVLLMAAVLGVSISTSWLNAYATAAGLFFTKLWIGLMPIVRRGHGRNR